MSNVDVVRGLYEAFGRGDMEAVIAGLDPDIEWVEPELEGLLYGGTHRGIESVVKDVFALMPQTWDEIELQPTDWIDGGDTVVVLGRFSARSRETGRQGSWRFAHVWTLRDGKIARHHPFFDTLAAQRALGGGS